MSIRTIARVFALAALVTGAAAAQSATTTHTETVAFPILGLGSTETLGVNLVNLATATSTGTASSCTGSVTFYNATGAAIGAASNFTLASNAASAVTLPYSSSGLTGVHGLLRAVVSVTLTSGVPCSLSTSLNTYDTATGATHVFITGGGVAALAPANPGH